MKKTTKKQPKKPTKQAGPERLPRRGLAKRFQVSPATVDAWRQASGFPKAERFKGTDVLAVAYWILCQPAHRSARSPARDVAAEIVNAAGGKIAKQASKKKPPKPAPPATGQRRPKKTTAQDTGAEAALVRLRQAERSLHDRWKEAVDNADAREEKYFKAWQDAADLLRRGETEYQKVLKARGDLVPMAEVRKWLGPLFEQLQTRILAVPPTISQHLEGLPWHEIQKQLMEALRNVLLEAAQEINP
jgi:hypothetical protein